MKKSDSLYVVVPTGKGKSVIAIEVAYMSSV